MICTTLKAQLNTKRSQAQIWRKIVWCIPSFPSFTTIRSRFSLYEYHTLIDMYVLIKSLSATHRKNPQIYEPRNPEFTKISYLRLEVFSFGKGWWELVMRDFLNFLQRKWPGCCFTEVLGAPSSVASIPVKELFYLLKALVKRHPSFWTKQKSARKYSITSEHSY